MSDEFLPWMEKNLVWIVITLAFVVPSAGFLFHEGFLGYDSYHFLGYLCGAPHLPSFSTNLGAELLFSALPCNEFLLKLLLIAFFGLSLYTIYVVGSLFGHKSGLLATLFVGITPMLVYSAFKLENDQFAYPIIFLSAFFFLKYAQHRNKKNLAISLILLAASTLFWGGGILNFFPYIALEPLLIYPFLLILIFLGTELTGAISPRFQIVENNPLWGMLYLVFNLPLLLRSKWSFTKNEFYLPATGVSLLLGIINPKFFILTLPFLALLLARIYSQASPQSKELMLYFALLFNIAWGMSMWFSPLQPTHTELLASAETVVYAQNANEPIGNDWALGHLIIYYGGNTQFHSTYPNLDVNNTPGRIILSRHDLDCTLVKTFDQPLFDKPLRLYDC